MKRALFIGTRLEACTAYSKSLLNLGYDVSIATLAGSHIAASTTLGKNALIFEPNKARALETLRTTLDHKKYSVVLSAGFPYIIPATLLTTPGVLFLNSHPHLLPEHKGINVIRESFDRGDTLYGATTHLMTPAVDDGEIIARQEIVIQPSSLSLIYELVFSFVEPATILQSICRLRSQGKLN